MSVPGPGFLLWLQTTYCVPQASLPAPASLCSAPNELAEVLWFQRNGGHHAELSAEPTEKKRPCVGRKNPDLPRPGHEAQVRAVPTPALLPKSPGGGSKCRDAERGCGKKQVSFILTPEIRGVEGADPSRPCGRGPFCSPVRKRRRRSSVLAPETSKLGLPMDPVIPRECCVCSLTLVEKSDRPSQTRREHNAVLCICEHLHVLLFSLTRT